MSDGCKESKGSGDAPTAKLASSYNYSQTYCILKRPPSEAKDEMADESHEVFFRCGNWCYQGNIQFNSLKMCTTDLPIIIPLLQRQQGSLRYYCNSNSIPKESVFSAPIEFMNDASEFLAAEVTSEHVEKELKKWSSMFSWIDDDSCLTYFELVCAEPPACMDKIAIMASKTYTRGLVIVSIYYERTVYFMIQSGEGDQQLLDVRFPDVSKHGQGLQLCSYNASYQGTATVDRDDFSSAGAKGSGPDDEADELLVKSEVVAANGSGQSWRKLTLWHVLDGSGGGGGEKGQLNIKDFLPKIKTMNIGTSNYQQTYCIMKSGWDKAADGGSSSSSALLSMHHDVLFRFGSWCYSGRIQLIPSLSLSDVPFVIPALRMQQSRLDFYCESSKVPTNSPFAPTLAYMQQITPCIEDLVMGSEDMLNGLIERLSNMGLGESVKKWLEGDPENSFFEFKLAPDAALEKMLAPMELVCSKCYHASGIITITILFEMTVYVCVVDGSNENPLLDSRFPDISGKGRGYQIQAYDEGIEGWPQLRKISIWQTVASLEQEFRERAAKLVAEAKEQLENGGEGGDSAATEGGVGLLANGSAEAGAKGETNAPGKRLLSAKEVEAGVSSDIDSAAASPAPTMTPSKAEDKASAPAGGTDSKMAPSANISPGQAALLGRPSMGAQLSSVSRPHHLPKVGGDLAKKMEEMKAKLMKSNGGDDGGEPVVEAPWDATGKPKMKQKDAK